MTGPGTNTFLIGRDQVAVLDPGPEYESHYQAILDAGADRIRWVVVTHTHKDHSPLAARLAAETGAELIGQMLRPADEFQDTSFAVERDLQDGERLQTPEFTLEAIYTPGHVGNHFCFYLHEDRLLFSGDHIMDGSTVVILPPSGDMKDYLDSLQRLEQYPATGIAPGHGNLIPEPGKVIDTLRRHRLMREQKVVSALKKVGPGNILDFLPVVYDDVEPKLHFYARFSLWAHLLKLERDGIARRTSRDAEFDQEGWELTAA
ncbi:MAG: MBL fold metallo-hydrolase [Porticoccaceae bacterium]|nr:MBL fold metallo-hydrolase [Porticoccaceae bacterium]